MKTCFIHAGAHKTGTTFIQARLLTLRSTLGNQGLHIPAIGTPDPKLAAHHNLAFDLNQNPRFRPKQGTIEDFVTSLRRSQPERMLLSSEDFLFLARNPAGMARLRKPLEDHGYRITWILYMRSYHEWLESAYTEQVKTGITSLPFHGWAEKRSRLVVHDPATSLAPFFDTGDPVILRSYALAKTDILRDFLHALGLTEFQAPADQTDHAIRNSRPNSLQVEFFRRLAAKKDKAQMKARELMAHARKISAKLPESPVFQAMSEESARTFYEESKDSYQGLLNRAGVTTPFGEFFPPPSPRQEQTFATLEFPPATRMALRELVEECLNHKP